MTTPSHLPSNGNTNPRATVGKIIDLIPAGQATFADAAFKWLRSLAIAGLAIVLGLIMLRLTVACFIGMRISAAVGRSAQAAGLDASITAWLKTVASFGLGLGTVGLVARAALGFFFPFGKASAGSWKPLAALIAASGIGTALPVCIQHARGVDESGLPAAMAEVDAAQVAWFNPKGDALIFFADHLDGQRRFWNRPGATPRDSMIAQPVTAITHGEWLRAQLEAQRKETAARQADEAAAQQAEIKHQREMEQQQAAARQREAAQSEEARRRAAEAAIQAALQQEIRELERATERMRLEQEQAAAQRAEAERLAAETARQREHLLAAQQLQIEAQRAAAEKASVEAVAKQTEIELQRVETQREMEQQQTAARQREAAIAAQQAQQHTIRLVGNQSQDRTEESFLQETFPPAQKIPLRQGVTWSINVKGDRVELWSDGPIAASADHGLFEEMHRPGHRMRFPHGGQQTIHVRPLSSSATTVFIRKLKD